MSRLLLALAILLTGCENFTLIGSVNLGSSGDILPAADEPDFVEPEPLCWPAAKDAVAEMKAHGYDSRKPEWAETAEWFTKLEPVKNSLPPCPAE